MGHILPGYYAQNGVTFYVRERGERTFVEITGEEFEFNANGYVQEPITEEMYNESVHPELTDKPSPDFGTFNSTFEADGNGNGSSKEED